MCVDVKDMLRAVEVAQLVKYLQLRHENMSLVPKHPRKAI